MKLTPKASIQCGLLLAVVMILPQIVSAQDYAPPAEEQAWLAATAHQSGTISPGTVITMQNWRQYQQFMPAGMIDLFEGKYFWKMPADVQMVVGPTVDHAMPPSYREATEKYSGQVRIQPLADGGMTIVNYQGGQAFPNPEEPYKGWKILVDEWFPPSPHLLVQAHSPDSALIHFCTSDRFQNRACVKNDLVYRQLAFNSDPGIPRVEPGAGDAYLSEWIMVEYPEESKYTADLTIFYQDFSKPQDDYVFVPAMRRSLRLSVSARCAPLFGSDMTHDDQKTGFNGGFTMFQAKYQGDRKVLAIMEETSAEGKFPDNYDWPLGWAKPSWGPWSLRDSYVVDVRRIPSLRPGYCYGSRFMIIDKQTLSSSWIDLYDTNMTLWKVASYAKGPLTDPASHQVYAWGHYTEEYWDLQNDHFSSIFGADSRGKDIVINGMAPKEYDNITKFSTPGGLMQIMQ